MSVPFSKREKDERVSEVIKAFYQAKLAFDEIVHSYRESGVMDYHRLAAFVENTAFDLKEECHSLFRNPDRGSSERIQPEDLFDVLIGSVFHELMKMKECAYQIQQYGPTYRKMRRAVQKGEAVPHEQAFIKACAKIDRRARRSIQTDVASAEELFRDTCDHIETMIPNYQTNRLLARTLMENIDIVDKAAGRGTAERLLGLMFEGRLDEAFLAAAREYLEGGWYSRAQRATERAKEANPSNPETDAILEKLEKARAAHRTKLSATSPE